MGTHPHPRTRELGREISGDGERARAGAEEMRAYYFSLYARMRSLWAASSRAYRPWARPWTSAISAVFERAKEGLFEEK
jgi:hypothetical protein